MHHRQQPRPGASERASEIHIYRNHRTVQKFNLKFQKLTQNSEVDPAAADMECVPTHAGSPSLRNCPYCILTYIVFAACRSCDGLVECECVRHACTT